MQWIIKNKQPPGKFIHKIKRHFRPIAHLLWARGARNNRDIRRFLEPRYTDDLGNPFLMKGVKECITRLKHAAERNERVLIYGDYDTDGVCGTIILRDLLERLGVSSVEIYLPYREKEGYGLHESAVRSFILRNINLLITVDCGVSNAKEIAFAKKFGFDVIVIDHHRPPKKLPQADVIVDPHQKGERYPFHEFAATGLVFKVAQAALRSSFLRKLGNLTQEWLDSFVDLVALATIGDMMPLLGENRIFVLEGMKLIRQSKRVGLHFLIQKARSAYTFHTFSSDTMRAYDISHFVVPPLNAAGRMDHASGAYKLLLANSEKEAKQLADLLIAQNNEKQHIVQRVVRAAERRIKKLKLEKEYILFEGDPSWPLSLTGVAAGKLAEKYWRPVCIYRRDPKESAGGCRTIPSYDLVKALTRCKTFLTKFGGHPAAAGWTCPNSFIDDLKKSFIEYAKEIFPKGLPLKPILIDQELSLQEVNKNFISLLEMFEPFGVGNEKPRFLFRDLLVEDFTISGFNLWLFLSQDTKRIRGLWSRNGKRVIEMAIGERLDIVAELDYDQDTRPILKIIDAKVSSSKI